MIISIIVPGPMSDARRFLPLKPVDLVILLALLEEERHGYALAREIESRTDGLVHLEPGNLYRVIRRLEDEGLIAESGRRPAADRDDERRRYYRITPLGADAAALEARRLRALLATPAVRTRLLRPEPV
jgi:DNA-binding PadR family transcriptional regulator